MDASPATGTAVAVATTASPTSPTPTHVDPAESGFHRLWEEALARYTQETGHDLQQAPFAKELEQCSSVDEVARVLNNRRETMKAFRAHGHKVRAVLAPVVRIMRLFLDTGAEVAAVVSVFSVTSRLTADTECSFTIRRGFREGKLYSLLPVYFSR